MTESEPKVPPLLEHLDLNQLAEESRKPTFGVYDVFFWRDAPDWYYKTFTSAGFMFSYYALRQYMDRHQLEVFLPPRAKMLPEGMRRGYRNREILKEAVLKIGGPTVVTAAVAGVYFGGAYYLGKYTGTHSWTDLAASGALSGSLLATGLLRPVKVRALVFGTLLGGAMGAVNGYIYKMADMPMWDERRDWQGWWWGTWVDAKAEKRAAAAKAAAAARTATPAAPST